MTIINLCANENIRYPIELPIYQNNYFLRSHNSLPHAATQSVLV